ncbi:hypothetical protein [Archangium sp.]|uniref:hypothetical protein n=1 Tax=Archangium sp. TaxID=1872627 RepID=UPI00286A1AB7|nr:hypothetical protein [Archangium sp.]
MKKLSIAMALCVAGTLVGTTALAGYKYVAEVTVDLVNRKASGSLADARASADTLQYIGCRTDTSASANVSIYCAAQDAKGVKAQCYSSAQNFVQMMSSLRSDSILIFTWDANNTCTSMNVENWSSNSPKQP